MAATVHQLPVAPPPAPTTQMQVLTVLFSERLHAVNAMTRELRLAGIRAIAVDIDSRAIGIAAEDAAEFSRIFCGAMRSYAQQTDAIEQRTRTSARVGAVTIYWDKELSQ